MTINRLLGDFGAAEMSHDWNDARKSGKSTPSDAFQYISYTTILKLDEFTTSIDNINWALRSLILAVNSLSLSRIFDYFLCVFSKKKAKMQMRLTLIFARIQYRGNKRLNISYYS